MSSRSLYRRHSPQFKLQLCMDIRNGKIGRREARGTYQISAHLIQLWLSQYDRGELNAEEAAATTISEYEAKIAALERKVGQLTMEVDLLKKTPRRPIDLSSDTSSIISGPLAAQPDGGVR
jgi:transposase